MATIDCPKCGGLHDVYHDCAAEQRLHDRLAALEAVAAAARALRHPLTVFVNTPDIAAMLRVRAPDNLDMALEALAESQTALAALEGDTDG